MRYAALLALVAAFAVAPAAFAQDAPADRHAQHVERLAETLDLTDAQRDLVTEATAEREPGTLWSLAAALTPTLTDAQKERLFTRPERPDRAAHQDRAERGERMKRDRPAERPDAEARAERREAHQKAMQDAMRSALDLSDEQVQQLDALHEARTAKYEARREARRTDRTADAKERMQNRPAPGEVPAEIAEILTPEQQEVFKVHRALAMQMHHRMMRNRPANR